MDRERLGTLGIFSGELGAFPAAVQRRVVSELEALGYGTIWYGEAYGREPFAQGALFIDATERMVVATGIANIYARDPFAMAFGGRSLNEMSGGRFVLGLGVAHASNVTARGHEYGRPVATMRAYLDEMDRAEPLWRGPEEKWAGEAGLVYGHLHVHLMFATVTLRAADGSEHRLLDRGRLVALDDPEVRALAARLGDPDALLGVDWQPKLPGVSAPGDYARYALDPATYIYREDA